MRPLNERHAFLLIEKDNAWITSRNRQLAETFATLVTRGDPVTVVKTGRVIVWGIYAGEPQESGASSSIASPTAASSSYRRATRRRGC